MLTWVAGLAGCAALLVAGRWTLRPVDALGRRRRFPFATLLALVSLCLAAAVPVARHRQLEDRLTAAASALAGVPVSVDCQTRGQEMLDARNELGWVPYDAAGVPERRTLIKREPCARLASYVGSRAERAAPGLTTVVAVHVLAHEVEHMRGSTAEASVECAAVQHDAAAARLLGASATEGAALARRYWFEVYPRMAEEYRSTQCRPGGALDAGLADAPWAKVSGGGSPGR